MALDLGTAMVISSALSTLFGGGGGKTSDMPGWLQDWLKRFIAESYGAGGVQQAIRLGGRMAADMPLTYQTLASELRRRPFDTAAFSGSLAAAADAARRFGEGATAGITRSVASRFGPGATSFDEGRAGFLSQAVADAIAREAFSRRDHWLQGLGQLLGLQSQYVKGWMPSHTGLRG